MTLILLFMLAALSGIMIFISLKSDRFHVARSVIIERGPEIVYPFINDFHKWGTGRLWRHPQHMPQLLLMVPLWARERSTNGLMMRALARVK